MIAILLLSLGLHAQEFVEKTFQGTSNLTNLVEARREIQDQAAQKSTEELVKELIGEDKFNRQKALIQAKILKNPARFIPFTKPGELKQEQAGFSMTVQLKLSPASLRQALQQLGVLNENEGQPVLLPMITFTDKVNMKSERWWTPAEKEKPGSVRTWARETEDAVQTAFMRSGFHMIRPQAAHLGTGLPKAFQVEHPTRDDQAFLGDWTGASLLLAGEISVQRSPESSQNYRVEIKLGVEQMSNARSIADVSRVMDTDNGNFDQVVEKKIRESVDSIAADLANQVLEAWQKGAIGSNQLRLSVRGHWTVPQIESLKEKLKAGSPQIRQIRERLFSKDAVLFEVESPSTPSEIAQKLNGFEWEGRRFGSAVDGDKGIVLNTEGSR